MDTVEKIYALTFRHRETGQILEGRILENNQSIQWMSDSFQIMEQEKLYFIPISSFITMMDSVGFTLTHKADLIAIWKKYREEQERADRMDALYSK